MQAKLLETRTLIADGMHNAFTDLCFWQDHYYLAFRKAQWHNIRPGGNILIYRTPHFMGPLLESTWTLCAEIDTGGDDRDPKFVTTENRIAVVFGTYYSRWGDEERSIPNARFDLISHIAFSHNGTAWGLPIQVYRPDYWFWSVKQAVENPEWYWAVAYHFAAPFYGEREIPDAQTIHLLGSEDLVRWYTFDAIFHDKYYQDISEPILLADYTRKTMRCMFRTEETAMMSHPFQSKEPITWRALNHVIHSPAAVLVGDTWILAGRSETIKVQSIAKYDKKDKLYNPKNKYEHATDLWMLGADCVQHILRLPSGGDCAYPGMVYDDLRNELIVSYYSQHERLPLQRGMPFPADIYLARIGLE